MSSVNDHPPKIPAVPPPTPSQKQDVATRKKSVHYEMTHLSSTTVTKAHIRLPIKTIEERMQRILDYAAHSTKFKFSDVELRVIESSMKKVSVIKYFEDFPKFAKTLCEEVVKELKHELRNSTEASTKERITKVEENLKHCVLENVKKFGLKPKPHKEVTRKEAAGLESSATTAAMRMKYSSGEPIPRYIHDFDADAEHTIPTSEYLANRISHVTLDSIHKSSETCIFIGPPAEMLSYYHLKGFRLVGQLTSPSSTPFYYFEKIDDPGFHAVVISEISNETRFNHQLLQLKYAGVDLRIVKVRGHLNDYLKKNNMELNNALAQFNPEIAFIGNRALAMIGLADRLYPQLMPPQTASEEEREKKSK